MCSKYWHNPRTPTLTNPLAVAITESFSLAYTFPKAIIFPNAVSNAHPQSLAHSNSNAYCYSNPYANSDPNTFTNASSNIVTHACAHSYTDCHANSNTDITPHARTHLNPNTYAHADTKNPNRIIYLNNILRNSSSGSHNTRQCRNYFAQETKTKPSSTSSPSANLKGAFTFLIIPNWVVILLRMMLKDGLFREQILVLSVRMFIFTAQLRN